MSELHKKPLTKTSIYGFQDFTKQKFILKEGIFCNDTRTETDEELMLRIENEMNQHNRTIMNFETIVEQDVRNGYSDGVGKQIFRVWYTRKS